MIQAERSDHDGGPDRAPTLLRWDELLARRARARDLALAEAARPGARALTSWRLPPELLPRILDALRRAEPDPPPASFGALFCPDPPVADPVSGAHPLHVWWGRLERVSPPTPPSSALERRAWAILALRWLGEDRDRLHRRAWAQHLPADPERDARALRLWRAWFQGDLELLWRGWADLYAERAASAVRIAETLGLARGSEDAYGLFEQERSSRVREVQEDFVLHCCDAAEGGPPVWREIAARVLEGAASDGPVRALGELLDPAGLERIAACAPHHPTWSPSWSTAAPAARDGDEAQNFLHFVRGGGAGGLSLDALLDAHLVLTLLDRWRQPQRAAAEPSWRVLEDQLQRARGRLRALVVEAEDRALIAALHEVPALHARTAAAVGRHYWEWARLSVRAGATAASAPVNRPCTLPRPLRRPVHHPGDRALERCWVLLVLLRGQGEALRRWIAEGGRTAGTFARLLTALPEALVDRPVGLHRTYGGLRASLSRHLDTCIRELSPALSAVAALPGVPPRTRRSAVHAALRPFWHPAVPLPEHGFPSMIEAAQIELDRGARP